MNLDRLLSKAGEFANSFGEKKVGTFHILLSLLDGDSYAKTVLSNQGITKEVLADSYTKGKIIKPIENENHALSPRAEYTLKFASEIAKEHGSSSVSSGHILVAVITDTSSLAYKLCSDTGVDIKAICDEVLEFEAEIASFEAADEEIPNLTKFGKDYTNIIRSGVYEEIFGREQEIQTIATSLLRKTKNNPCLVGDAGVGKSAIVMGFAEKCLKGQLGEEFKKARVIELDLALLTAGTKFRGDLEERIKSVILEATSNPNIILFIDEIHCLMGNDNKETGGLANILKPAMARGEIRLIGATTYEEYRKHIEKDAALSRRFEKINIDEPTGDETLDILVSLRHKFEKYHNVCILSSALSAAVNLASQYLHDTNFPDKAIDLLDATCASKSLADKKSAEPNTLEKNIELAIMNKEFELADKLSQKLDEDDTVNSNITITDKDIAENLASRLGINASDILIGAKEERLSLLNLETTLKEEIVGQDEAIEIVSRIIRRARAGLKDASRPLGSFLFLGDTGVGKTHLANVLAENLYPNKTSIIRLDMSEYIETTSINRIIGSPPGYIGYDDGSSVCERIRRNPNSIILFDEVEKAHPDVLNILLQILDNAKLTDSSGNIIHFNNTIVILTSNIGTAEVNVNKVGFDYDSVNDERGKKYLDAAKKHFKKELLARLDAVVPFNNLLMNELTKIARKYLDALKKRVLEQANTEVNFPDSTARLVAKMAKKEKQGARPIKKIIETKIENTLADKILSQEIAEG